MPTGVRQEWGLSARNAGKILNKLKMGNDQGILQHRGETKPVTKHSGELHCLVLVL